MKLTVLALLGLATSAAHAGPLADCYDDAASNNAGLSMTVSDGGANSVTTANVGVFVQAVAQYHTHPNVTVSYNAAGKAAIQEALTCAWDADIVTLSSVWLNQEVADLTLKADSLRLQPPVTSANPSIAMDFDEIGTPCTGGESTTMNFSGEGGSASIAVEASGAHDYKVGSVQNDVLCLSWQDSSCAGECNFECLNEPPWTSGCVCTGLGDCYKQEVPPGFPGAGAVLVIPTP